MTATGRNPYDVKRRGSVPPAAALAAVVLCPILTAAVCLSQPPPSAPAAPALSPPVGGANSPKPTPPPPLAIQTAELDAGAFAVRVPTGSYAAPKEGATSYSVPGPITALLNIEPFKFSAGGINFDGTVGLVIRSAAGVKLHPIRASKLQAN